MGLLLLTAGGLFALLFLINIAIRTLRRNQTITFGDTLLAFLALLVPVAALIVDNSDTPLLDNAESGALIIAGVVGFVSLIILIAEVFRPQRLRKSRGIFGLGIGVLLAFASVSIPYMGRYIQVAAMPPPLPTAVNNPMTPVEVADDARFRAFFNQVMQIIAEETGLDAAVVVRQMREEDVSVAELVATNGGSLDIVNERIVELMNLQVEQLVSDGRITPMQAAGALLLIPNLVRTSLTNDLQSLEQIFGRSAATPLPATETQQAQAFETFMAVTKTFTPTPTATRTATPSATVTRTPRPTSTPSATRERFVSRTPTFTPTLPNPCIAVMKFNVNMRAEPNLDAALVQTIPFETVVTVFGRNKDSTWWFGTYEDQAGWMSSEFIIVSSACDDLPIRN